jgi:type III restriction enzyme
METGTGKTYVYLRTALELHRATACASSSSSCRRSPSARASSRPCRSPATTSATSTTTALPLLRLRFGQPVPGAPVRPVRQRRVHGHDPGRLQQADINVIHQSTDRLQGETPIHLVQAARPILILDEPQNMESELSISRAGRPESPLRPALQRHPPQPLQRRLPPDPLRGLPPGWSSASRWRRWSSSKAKRCGPSCASSAPRPSSAP